MPDVPDTPLLTLQLEPQHDKHSSQTIQVQFHPTHLSLPPLCPHFYTTGQFRLRDYDGQRNVIHLLQREYRMWLWYHLRMSIRLDRKWIVVGDRIGDVWKYAKGIGCLFFGEGRIGNQHDGIGLRLLYFDVQHQCAVHVRMITEKGYGIPGLCILNRSRPTGSSLFRYINPGTNQHERQRTQIS